MFKIRGPLRGQKSPLLSLPSNAQLVSNFVKKYKSLAVEGGRHDYLFWVNVQNIFFELPKLNKYCLGVELAPAHRVTKKLKMDHLWVYTPCPTPCHNGYRM